MRKIALTIATLFCLLSLAACSDHDHGHDSNHGHDQSEHHKSID